MLFPSCDDREPRSRIEARRSLSPYALIRKRFRTRTLAACHGLCGNLRPCVQPMWAFRSSNGVSMMTGNVLGSGSLLIFPATSMLMPGIITSRSQVGGLSLRRAIRGKEFSPLAALRSRKPSGLSMISSSSRLWRSSSTIRHAGACRESNAMVDVSAMLNRGLLETSGDRRANSR